MHLYRGCLPCYANLNGENIRHCRSFIRIVMSSLPFAHFDFSSLTQTGPPLLWYAQFKKGVPQLWRFYPGSFFKRNLLSINNTVRTDNNCSGMGQGYFHFPSFIKLHIFFVCHINPVRSQPGRSPYYTNWPKFFNQPLGWCFLVW